MENMTRKVEQMVRRNVDRRRWKRFVSVPAALVVAFTTYVLILPAIAMEGDTFCGMEEHKHSDECYVDELTCGFEEGQEVQNVQAAALTCDGGVHEHTDDCYDDEGNVICGYADFVVHTHGSRCYDASGALICTLPEIEEHEHTDECYATEKVNVCGLAETEGHVHTEACYGPVSHQELTCGMEETAGHTHSDGCYTTYDNTYLACGQEEYDGHHHSESCYNTYTAEDGTEVTELVCGQEESEGHHHSDGCYATETVTELTCGQSECAPHTHDESCYTTVETTELVCGKEEAPAHTHTDECFTTETVTELTCDKPEAVLHTHTDECYDEDGNRICGKTEVREHVHADECFTAAEAVTVIHHHTELCYTKTLVCDQAEHVHSLACYQEPEEEALVEFEDGQIEIAENAVPNFDMPILVCGVEEHEHSTSCLDENMVYTCGMAAHVHTGECYAIPGMEGVTPILVCQAHEHFHTEDCYNEAGELACGIEAHIHGVGCFALPEGVQDPDEAAPSEAATEQKVFENEDVIVTATYGPEAGIPADAELRAGKITAESDPEHYADRMAQASAKLGENAQPASQMVIYNIGFYDGHGCEIEPLSPVQMKIQFKNSEGFAVDGAASVVHFVQDGNVELLETVSDLEANAASFTTGSFSDFVIVK